jgi:ABC-type oligopeptide transport system substrate-binding subunit
MNRQFALLHSLIPLAALVAFMLIITGCGDSTDLPTQVSGKWQNENNNDIIDIHLAKESSSLTIDGRTFNGVVEDIDKGSDTVRIKMTTENGDTEVWSIHQVWNNNGSAFKLKLRRNGTTETLSPVGQS